jgi:two-component system, OmpR family, phosphate regulon sensor histidine kinase PhoR
MRKIVVFVLVASLLGLGLIQYRFLIIGLRFSKTRFDMKMGEALQEMRQELYPENALTLLLASVVRDDAGDFPVGIDTLEGASLNYLGDFLKDRLMGKGVNANFDFALTNFNGEKIYLKTEGFEKGNGFSDYAVQLGGHVPRQCNCGVFLRLKPHNLINYLLSQLNNLIIPSLVFFALIAGCFWWLLRFLSRQRRLDAIKNDFINNLTHELKTPVFTIGLTAKMLREQISDEKGRSIYRSSRKRMNCLKRISKRCWNWRRWKAAGASSTGNSSMCTRYYSRWSPVSKCRRRRKGAVSTFSRRRRIPWPASTPPISATPCSTCSTTP